MRSASSAITRQPVPTPAAACSRRRLDHLEPHLSASQRQFLASVLVRARARLRPHSVRSKFGELIFPPPARAHADKAAYVAGRTVGHFATRGGCVCVRGSCAAGSLAAAARAAVIRCAARARAHACASSIAIVRLRPLEGAAVGVRRCASLCCHACLTVPLHVPSRRPSPARQTGVQIAAQQPQQTHLRTATRRPARRVPAARAKATCPVSTAWIRW